MCARLQVKTPFWWEFQLYVFFVLLILSSFCFGLRAFLVSHTLFLTSKCGHFFCYKCLSARIQKWVETDEEVGELSCGVKGCVTLVPGNLAQRCLTQEMYNLYDSKCLRVCMNHDETFVNCPNPECGIAMGVDRIPEKSVPPRITEKDNNGKDISWTSWVHFNQYRLRCRGCNIEFCTSCKEQPYHRGRFVSGYYIQLFSPSSLVFFFFFFLSFFYSSRDISGFRTTLQSRVFSLCDAWDFVLMVFRWGFARSGSIYLQGSHVRSFRNTGPRGIVVSAKHSFLRNVKAMHVRKRSARSWWAHAVWKCSNAVIIVTEFAAKV